MNEGLHEFLKMTGWDAANLAVFLFLLVWFGRAPFRALFVERAEAASREVREAQERKGRAEERVHRARSRLEGLPREAQAILGDGRAEGEMEARKVAAAAAARAQGILREAGDLAAEEERLARQGLRREVVREALKQAALLLKERVGPPEEGRFLEDLLASARGGSSPRVGGRA